MNWSFRIEQINHHHRRTTYSHFVWAVICLKIELEKCVYVRFALVCALIQTNYIVHHIHTDRAAKANMIKVQLFIFVLLKNMWEPHLISFFSSPHTMMDIYSYFIHIYTMYGLSACSQFESVSGIYKKFSCFSMRQA